MAWVLLPCALACGAPPASAQRSLQSEPRFYAELLGVAGPYSLNIEHDLLGGLGVRFGVRGSWARAGWGAAAAVAGPTWRLGGRGAEALYVGAGAVMSLGGRFAGDPPVDGQAYGYGSAALHLQTRSPGGFVRMAYTPLFNSHGWKSWAGIAVGWGF